MCMFVYVENTALASSIKNDFSPVCACVHIGKVLLNQCVYRWLQ